MRRVLPDAPVRSSTPRIRSFTRFSRSTSLDPRQAITDAGDPTGYGIFEDNDPESG